MDIGIGIIGGGYMGKAHAVAMSSVGAVFNTKLRPRLEMVCAQSETSAQNYQRAYGFARATSDPMALVKDARVDAVIIASPQTTHAKIALAAFEAGKHVFCEKPLGGSFDEAMAMAAAARASGLVHMSGFNYVRTPATQYAKSLIDSGALGQISWFRGEHTEDFLHDPEIPANWRTDGAANGTMGDLAPHMINCALRLMGPMREVSAEIETVISPRPSEKGAPRDVTNDDQAQIMVRFENGAMGHLYFSRIATGRKMGYVYEIFGTKGALRFDQEDQNALWHYDAQGDAAQQGFRKILTGPAHPDYLPFCQGPGHGTGYQDQIIIEAKDFLEAIDEGKPRFPSFEDGLASWHVVEAARASAASQAWVKVAG